MEKSLKWLAPILDMSGYASAARGYIKACDVFGLKIRVKDRSRSTNLHNKGIDQSIVDLYTKLSATEVPADAPCVQHQVPDVFYKDSKTSCQIGFTIFEMNNIPKHWVPYCNQMATIWTGSEYSKQAFLNSGVTVPIHVLPHAIDTDFYSPNAQPWLISNKRAFSFISIFDFTARKAWQELLRAYWTAFSSKDDVCLILKVYFSDFSDSSRKDIIRRIANYKISLGFTETPPILIYGHDVPNNQMPNLYRTADCYVGISREGFGLPYAEAMACGLPVIGPEVGGTRQFMNEDNSFLVKYIGNEPISKEMIALNESFQSLSWAKHSWEHLSEVMKQVYQNKELRDQKAIKGLDFIRTELNYETIGKRIEDLLP